MTTRWQLSDKQRRVRQLRAPRTRVKLGEKGYATVCISLYEDDLDRMDALVGRLQGKGHTKMNRSQLIREAVRQFDPSTIPEPRR